MGFDSWSQFGFGEQLNNPGPLDNSNLLKGTVCSLRWVKSVPCG